MERPQDFDRGRPGARGRRDVKLTSLIDYRGRGTVFGDEPERFVPVLGALRELPLTNCPSSI